LHSARVRQTEITNYKYLPLFVNYRAYNIQPENTELLEEQMDIGIHLSSQLYTALFSLLGREPAYLDPGSGSYFVQLLLASLMGALFFLGVYRKKVTDFIRNLFSRSEADEDIDD
jgi:hypothetical protein